MDNVPYLLVTPTHGRSRHQSSVMSVARQRSGNSHQFGIATGIRSINSVKAFSCLIPLNDDSALSGFNLTFTLA